MIPHHFYYQLVILGLLWLCVLLHLAWSSPGTTLQTPPSMPITPRRKRSKEPTPFVGLTHKPPCALCEQEAAYPHAPPPVPPAPMPPTHSHDAGVLHGAISVVLHGLSQAVARHAARQSKVLSQPFRGPSRSATDAKTA